jgi:hypothetical protein
VTLTDQIPGLREAIEQEQHIRDTSFLALPESVCGFDVNPLTLRHVLTLGAIGSPFMRGGYPMPHDVGAFMVVVGDWSGFKRWRNLRKLSRVETSKVIAEIDLFIKESFQDSPGGSGKESGASYYSFAAALVDVFGKEYGWTEYETLNVPLKRMFQYIKAISRRNGETVLFNPSDRVRGQWLETVNKRN